MSTTKMMYRALRTASMLLALSLAAGCTPQDPKHHSFASPEQAVDALIAAIDAQNIAELTLLVGPGGASVLSSGDTVADARDRAEVAAAYRVKHALVAAGDGRAVLHLGANDWTFPIPLVRRDGRWYLDGAAGAEEVIYRRVGRNELGAIAVCRGFVDAQNDYALEGHDGNEPGLYAAHLISDPETNDGLYWPTAEGEAASPAGPLVAAAAREGYRPADRGAPTPYYGYFYRMLYAQGPNAPGGAKEYFESGRLVDGFALVAWPAEYGVSGVKTLIVNQDGVVYEKDLGSETATAVRTLQLFDPDGSWAKVEPIGPTTSHQQL